MLLKSITSKKSGMRSSSPTGESASWRIGEFHVANKKQNISI
jgi:hypothetical protein